MPTYEFRNKATGVVITLNMPISQREIYLNENPSMEQIITECPAFGDSTRLGIKTTPDGFKEVLHKIADNNYKSNLKDKLSRN